MAGPGGCKLAPFEGASGEDVVKYIGRAIEVRMKFMVLRLSLSLLMIEIAR